MTPIRIAAAILTKQSRVPMRKILAVIFLSLPWAAAAAEDPRVSFLEQEVRNLNRQVAALTQQVNALRSQPERRDPGGQSRSSAPALEVPSWVDAAKWRRVRAGMAEIDVIAALGPPTSMREQDGARVLLYAMETGASGFLGGSVTLRDRVVVDVRQPYLQ